MRAFVPEGNLPERDIEPPSTVIELGAWRRRRAEVLPIVPITQPETPNLVPPDETHPTKTIASIVSLTPHRAQERPPRKSKASSITPGVTGVTSPRFLSSLTDRSPITGAKALGLVRDRVTKKAALAA